MSLQDQNAKVTAKQDPKEFFETIGDKVKNFSETNGADEDDGPAVEEVESLCMTCGKNVCFPTLAKNDHC